MIKIKEVIKIGVLPIMLVVIHLLLVYKTNIYAQFPLLDIPMHIFGGLTIAISFMLFTKTFKIKLNKKIDGILLILCFVVFCSIFIELAEFSLFGAFYFGLSTLDVIQDLFFALVGGSLLICLTNKNL